jgi:methionyl-tRNA synthetase
LEQPAKKHASTDKLAEGLISFDDFKKIDLRVAEIVAAEPVKKSQKLLKLTVNSPENRTIVAGIAEHYSPDELIGRQVIIVANLKPAKLMGIRSEGMVLVAKMDVDGKERLVLSSISDIVVPGSKVA